MARRNKLMKFTELLTFPNVYENFDPSDNKLVWIEGKKVEMKGKWQDEHFKNENPITLELACGRGEYTLALAHRYPERNFIGMDIKGARIWKGASQALEHHLSNVAFIRTKIELSGGFLAKNEIDEIWITFPDPFLKSKKYNRRLTSPNYLSLYGRFLRNDGRIHLKTDSDELFEHTMEVLDEGGHKVEYVDEDIYRGTDLCHPDLDIKTYYEKQHLNKGKTIKYVRFRLNSDLRGV